MRSASILRRSFRLAAWLAVAVQTLAAPSAGAQSSAARLTQEETARELLNSERIEQRFGSYGIEVLEADGTLRVSNLYSETGGRRTGRTFAIVLYPAAVAPALADEHAEVASGGSIGAVFARAGWVVSKRHLWFGEVQSKGRAASLMDIGDDVPLAAHVYVFRVQRAGTAYDYATIAELHHPDYLRADDLPALYGPAAATGDDAALVRRMLDAAGRAMR